MQEIHPGAVSSIEKVANPGPGQEELTLRSTVSFPSSQCHTAASGGAAAEIRGSHTEEEFDGVAELWFDSFEFLAENAKRPEAAEAGRLLYEDELNFIDVKNSPIFWVNENNVSGRNGGENGCESES